MFHFVFRHPVCRCKTCSAHYSSSTTDWQYLHINGEHSSKTKVDDNKTLLKFNQKQLNAIFVTLLTKVILFS